MQWKHCWLIESTVVVEATLAGQKSKSDGNTVDWSRAPSGNGIPASTVGKRRSLGFTEVLFNF